jgi:DNA-nicking Smr family endonuclease
MQIRQARYGQESGDPTIDLHGLRVADALRRVHSFLLAEQARDTFCVRIVTGNGTGAVKSAVRDMLTGHAAVASWRPTLTGDAAMIVTLNPPRR